MRRSPCDRGPTPSVPVGWPTCWRTARVAHPAGTHRARRAEARPRRGVAAGGATGRVSRRPAATLVRPVRPGDSSRSRAAVSTYWAWPSSTRCGGTRRLVGVEACRGRTAVHRWALPCRRLSRSPPHNGGCGLPGCRDRVQRNCSDGAAERHRVDPPVERRRVERRRGRAPPFRAGRAAPLTAPPSVTAWAEGCSQVAPGSQRAPRYGTIRDSADGHAGP